MDGRPVAAAVDSGATATTSARATHLPSEMASPTAREEMMPIPPAATPTTPPPSSTPPSSTAAATTPPSSSLVSFDSIAGLDAERRDRTARRRDDTLALLNGAESSKLLHAESACSGSAAGRSNANENGTSGGGVAAAESALDLAAGEIVPSLRAPSVRKQPEQNEEAEAKEQVQRRQGCKKRRLILNSATLRLPAGGLRPMFVRPREEDIAAAAELLLQQEEEEDGQEEEEDANALLPSPSPAAAPRLKRPRPTASNNHPHALLLVLLALLLSSLDTVRCQHDIIVQRDGGGGMNPDIVRREYYVQDRGPAAAAAGHRRDGGGVFGGVVPGMFLTALSSYLLWWNEGRYVRDATMHRTAEGAVVTIPEAKGKGEGGGEGIIDPANDGRLVHVAGDLDAGGGLIDPTYGLRRPDVLRLSRNAESYQWMEDKTETKTRVNDRESRVEVTYRYRKGWTGRHVDSGRFEAPNGHMNPASPRFDLGREGRTVNDATLKPSGLAVPAGLIDQLGGFSDVGLGDASSGLLPYDDVSDEEVSAVVAGDTLYFTARDPSTLRTLSSLDDEREGGPAIGRGGADSGASAAKPTTAGRKIAVSRFAPQPQVGDVRVSWREVRPPREGVSVLAEQRDGKLVPWTHDETGHGIYKLVEGRVSARTMIADLREESAVLTKFLRFVGWFGNFVGWNLLLSCVSAIASRIPLGIGALLEPLANVATSIVAFGAASGLSAAVFAAAWLRFRPLVAAGLAALSAAGFYGPMWYARWKRRPEVAVIDAKLGASAKDERSGK